ncbi:MAG: hypothetical protein DCF16_16905 [Alphaproteobacteria bacterium]|nr:MAG: hypothetical protein DCF16_16905 [Alphaproteobacteria bacterium]
MSEKKDLKRAAQDVWSRVKTLRSDRGKLYSPEDLEASAAELAQCATDLKLIAKQKSALSAMPATPAKKPKPAKKSKKPAAEGDA